MHQRTDNNPPAGGEEDFRLSMARMTLAASRDATHTEDRPAVWWVGRLEVVIENLLWLIDEKVVRTNAVQLDERLSAIEQAIGGNTRVLSTLAGTVADLSADARLDHVKAALDRLTEVITAETATLANALTAPAENEQRRDGELIETLTSVRDVLDEHVSVYGQLDTIRRDVDEIRRVLAVAATSRVEKTAADMEKIEQRRRP